MRRAVTTLLVATLMANIGVATAASAHIGATDILYMDAAGWQRAPLQDKLALSAAFMRIFCTDIKMTPEDLVSCLDHDGRSGAVFERAIACSASLSRG